MSLLGSTALILIDSLKNEANTPHISNADAARAIISNVQFARASDALQSTSNRITKAEAASNYYLTLTQDQVLGAEFSRTIALLKQRQDELMRRQEELSTTLVNTWDQTRTIHVKTLQQIEDAIANNYDVKSLRESSTIHQQYERARDLKDPLLTKIAKWKVEWDVLQNKIETIYADVLSRLPDRDKSDTKRFPPPAYISETKPGFGS